MAAVILPDADRCVKVVMTGSNQGLPFVNTWYLQHAGGTMDQATMNTLANATSSAWWSNFGPLQHTQTQHVTTQTIDLSTRQGFFGTDSGSHVGTGPATSRLPVNVACCISWTIQDRYRGGHPRMYIPVETESFISGGNKWSATVLPQLQSAASAFTSAMNALTTGGTTWKHVAVRYIKGGIIQDPPIIRLVSAAVVHERVDSMRRRLGRESK